MDHLGDSETNRKIILKLQIAYCEGVQQIEVAKKKDTFITVRNSEAA